MGNEMGNNNTTSALNEENNASEAEKKTFNEEVTAESNEEENQKISAAKGSDDGETKADDGLASNDRTEPGNDTSKGHTLGDSEKGENQMEGAAKLDSDDAIIEPGKDTLEEHSHEDDDDDDDVKGPNQMIPRADDAENVEEKARGSTTTVGSTILLENDSSKSDAHLDVVFPDSPVHEAATSRGDVVIVENQMPLELHEAPDTSSASNDVPNVLENATTQEGNAGEDAKNGDHRNHPLTEGEIVQEKGVRIDLDDRTSELQDKTQKETHDNDEPGENAMDPISEDLDVILGKDTNLSYDDQSNVKDSFSDSGHQKTEIIQVEKSPNVALENKGGENCKTNSNFSLESTEEYEDKQIDLCKDHLVTYDHHLDKESSNNQEEENTVVLTSHDDVELQESSQIHSFHDVLDEILQEPSLHGSSESLQRSDHLPDTDTLPLMDDDDDDDDVSSDKEKETQENMLLLAEVNHITDQSLDSPPESDMLDKKMCKELQVERKLNLSGSEVENSQDFEANGDCNGEGNIVLASDQFDVCINNNTTSDEIIRTAPVQQGFMVPEAEGDDELIAGSKVVNCRLEQEGNYEEKVLEEIGKKPEGSDQFNSHLLTSGQKESNTLQNSLSMLHVSSHQEEDNNVSQTKTALDSSTLIMPALNTVDNEAFEKEAQGYSQRAEATSLKEAEITTSEANAVSANGGYEVMGSITTRYSTESNHENPNICCLMQKSPSFNLNLRIEATTKEEYADHIPLLHDQGKTATESVSNQSSLNVKPCAEYEQGILKYEEMPVEEKIVTMERSYSEKFHNAPPFLGLLKEEEEAHLLVMPKKQENEDGALVKEVKEMEYALPNKGKEKRKPSRPSFFSSCMCCMTLTN